MVLLDELRVTMSDYRKDLKELYEVLGIEKAQARYDALQKQVADPDFYSDLENSQKVLQEVKSLENRIEKYEKMEETLDDILTLIELTMEEGEEESNAELNEEADKFVKELESLKLASLLTGEYDSSNAILTFHAGAGGTEAQDWAEMLYRMYNRWAERHNFKAELLDYLDGDEAGLKSASIMISGDNAYGFLKSESGVHRLVRVSPFDSSGRRHTSFAALEVMPEIDDSMEVDIRPEDIKMDVFRASGAGGQHINKTSSAVRLTHLPTGIVVSCQTQRSQYQNKDYAMKMLRAKLVEIKEREHLDKIADIKVTKQSDTVDIGSKAVELLPGRMVASQSPAVDGVTGATITTEAIRKAVSDCVKQAGVDPASLVPLAVKKTGGQKTLETDMVVVGGLLMT